jgi:hypothetical protein
MEQTSEEILASAPVRALPADDLSLLRQLLLRADLVKFAKYQPSPAEHESAMTSAVAFVEHTHGAPVEQPDTVVSA